MDGLLSVQFLQSAWFDWLITVWLKQRGANLVLRVALNTDLDTIQMDMKSEHTTEIWTNKYSNNNPRLFQSSKNLEKGQ